MDNFLLHAIVAELGPLLIGYRLGRVYQIGATDLYLDFRLRDGRYLFISTDPQRLSIHLTSRSPKKLETGARTDTAFISLVRKHFGSARLTGIEKTGYDRIAIFEFDVENESGNLSSLQMVVSLTGRAANCLLVEDGRIIASLREREEATENFILPAPPADKLDPTQCSVKQLENLIARWDGDIEAAALNNLIGFSPIYARQFRALAKRMTPHQALSNILSPVFDSPVGGLIYSKPSLVKIREEIGGDNVSLILSLIELDEAGEMEQLRLDSVNEACDRYFTLLEERRRFLGLRRKLISHLSSKAKKQRRLLNNLQRELAGFANIEMHQRYGELLLASLHQAEKIDDHFRVVNFYDENQAMIDIPTAEKATPQEAAEHYFKLARKSRHGKELLTARIPDVELEIARIETSVEAINAATHFDEIAGFAAKYGLPTANRASAKGGSKKPGAKVKSEKVSGVRRYRSSDGYEILVGRTDRDNDNLTMRVAKSFDLWFHAADYPGSHVVLRNPQRKPVPPRSISEAAQIAAKFSQAKESPKVAVNYCEKKFVTKPKGFAPGQVRLSSFKTIIVAPGETAERIIEK